MAFGDKIQWSFEAPEPTVNDPAVDLMNRRESAKFVGMSETHFSRCVAAKRLPQGVQFNNIKM